MNLRAPFALFALTLLLSSSSSAEEGMWPYNMAPVKAVKDRYGFEMTPPWLRHAMLSSVRFNNGGSGSFVSDRGLVMTNHHVGADCIQKLSQGDLDAMKNGYYARTLEDERKCPDLELNQLVKIVDVTTAVKAAANALGPEASDAKKGAAKKAEMAKLTKTCADETGLRCDVVTLYAGGAYHLYQYKRFTDVRLVFAPEVDVAFFGGDQDNFTYPRMCLDVAFFRVYEDDKPAAQEDFLAFSKEGAKNGDLIFVSGHPGSTGRLATPAELKFLRDVTYPYLLERFKARRDMLTDYMKRGEKEARAARDDLFGTENAIKALTGYLGGLNDQALYDEVVKRHEDIKAGLASAPEKDRKRMLEAWPKLESAYANYSTFYKELAVTERRYGPGGTLVNVARHLLRAGAEKKKPNEKRLPEYRETSLQSLELQLFSEAPIDDGLEIEKIALGLEAMRQELGPRHPAVRKALAGKSPKARAAALVQGTRLKDIAVRQALYKGGSLAVARARDPMIRFVKTYDALARELRKKYEDKFESVKNGYSGRIAEALATVYGRDLYPDATFTLRINYGTVKGFTENGREIAWRTQMGDLYAKAARAKGQKPYQLPKRWSDAMGDMDFTVPFNFVSTNDIIGGNSGSPVFDRRGEVVGLIFDGNIHQLSNRFLYRDDKERAVSVHVRGIVHALDKVYDADPLLTELGF